MLHLLSKPLYEINIDIFLQILMQGDEIFLLQDGIIMGFKNHVFLKKLSTITVAVFALKNDVEARGVLQLMSSSITLIDYNEFITLSINHIQQIHW
ncbi:MAG: sulfurtransferase complex subunit TusB [Candidatus Dasytiphilus stammeri]